jgi:hypothetical protein
MVFSIVGHPWRVALQPEVFVCWDDVTLYVGARLPKPPGRALKADARGEDTKAWYDDGIEVFLDLGCSRTDYYMFSANSRDGRWDAINGHSKFDAEWHAVSNVDPQSDSWTIELGIPFAILGEAPAVGDTWGFNVIWARQTPASHVFTWAPLDSSHLEVQHFGTLHFGATSLNTEIEIGETRDTGVLTVQAKGRVEGAPPQLAVAGVSEEGEFHPWSATPSKVGQDGAWKVKIEAPKDKLSAASALVVDLLGNGQLLSRAVTPARYYPAVLNIRECLLREHTIQVEADTSVCMPNFEPTQLEARLVATDIPITEGHIKPDSLGQGEVWLNPPELSPGTYSLEVAARVPGSAPFTCRQPVEVHPKPEWLGNDIGLTDEVLPPWIPMVVDDPSVNVWGRSYTWDAFPFPAQVSATDVELLSAPIELVAVVDGERQTFRGAPPVFSVVNPARVELTTRAEAKGAQIEGKLWCEFDGCIRSDWQISPTHAGNMLDTLYLEVPFHRDQAKLVHLSEPGPVDVSSPDLRGLMVQARSHALEGPKNAPPQHHIWVGDQERGLAWFVESHQNFCLNSTRPAVEFIPNGDVLRVRIHLVQSPRKLDSPLDYTFGFIATPMKPVERTAWDTRTFRTNRYGIETRRVSDSPDAPLVLDEVQRLGGKTLYFHEGWSRIQNYYQPEDPEGLRAFIDACHKRGMQAITYYGFELSNLAPEWDTYRHEILDFPQVGGHYRQPPQRCYNVCYNSAWQDYLCWAIARTIDDYGVDGVYLDGTASAHACANRAHGCGYVDDSGLLCDTRPYFGVRELMKRIYTIVKTRKPNGQVDAHKSGYLDLPLLAFATTYWSGETLARTQRHDEFAVLDYLPTDAVQTMFMGHNLGVAADFLSYGRPYTYTEALALMLAHDTPVRALGTDDMKVLTTVWEAFDAFGRNEAEWLPYWSNDEWLQVTPNGPLCSAYRHPKNGLLLAVSNLAHEPWSGTLAIGLDILGMPEAAEAQRCLTKEKLSISRGELELSVKSGAFELVWIRPAAQ